MASKRSKSPIDFDDAADDSRLPPRLRAAAGVVKSNSPAEEIPLASISPNPLQPRRAFDEAELDALADSIRQNGVLLPLILRRAGARYEIVAGERRFRAAERADLVTVPAIVRELTDREARLVAVIENLQRQNLNKVEEVASKLTLVADALDISEDEAPARLRSMRHYPDQHAEDIERLEDLFRGLGREKWTSFTTNGLPLLNLPAALLDAVRSGKLPYTSALRIKTAPEHLHGELLDGVLAGTLTLADVQTVIDKHRHRPQPDMNVPTVRKLLTAANVKKVPAADQPRLQAAFKVIQELLGNPHNSGMN